MSQSSFPLSSDLEQLKRPLWKFQTTLTPWSILLYPLTTIQTRGVCVPYLRPAGSITPDWIPKDVSIRIPLLSSCTSDAFSVTTSIISGTVKSFQLIIAEEGWLGLYRGFGTFLLHGAIRDMLIYHTLQFCYVPVRDTFHWIKGTITGFFNRFIHRSISSNGKSTDPQPNGDAVLPESEDKIEPVARISTVSVIPRPRPSISPVLDFSHVFIKALADAVVYPLLVIGSRLTVYEGPESISFFQMAELSWTFDGFLGGLYCGFLVHFLNRLVDDVVDLICVRLCRHRKLTWPHTLTIRAGTFTILGSLTAPLASLGLIQRTQSNVPGLSDPSVGASQLLTKMPWKLLTLNVALTTLIAGFNIALFLAEGKTSGLGPLGTDAIEPLDDEEL